MRTSILLSLAVVACPLWAQHSNVPVVLLDGYEWRCIPTPTAGSYFGQLPTLLHQDGAPVYFFGNCPFGSAGIDQMGAAFGQYLSTLASPVDVIAHSMGGLIVRSYLAGLNLANGTIGPPVNPRIRKLILIGTPNFGTDFNWPISTSTQVNEMQYGSSLTWTLATWNQGMDDLRGVDAIAIAGNAVTDPDGVVSDGIVAVASASLDFAYPNRTRVIPYCHISPAELALLGVSCSAASIVDIYSPDLDAYKIIRSFLDGTTEWESIGIPPAQATNNHGGFIWNVFDVNDQPIGALATNLISGGWSNTVKAGPSVSYVENAIADSAGVLNFMIIQHQASYTVSGNFIDPGGFHAIRSKFGPAVFPRGIISSAGIPPGAQSMAPGSLISIYGSSLASSAASGSYPWPSQLAGVTVNIDGVACPLNYAGPGQVNALIPGNLQPGIHGLTIKTSQGLDYVTLMLEPAVPTIFNYSGAAAALHGNYQPISPSSPAGIGETISLFATGLGAVTMHNGLQVANTIPAVLVDGHPAAVTYAGRAPGYDGLDQINIQIPAGVRSGGTVPLTVTSGNRTSNQVLLAVN